MQRPLEQYRLMEKRAEELAGVVQLSSPETVHEHPKRFSQSFSCSDGSDGRTCYSHEHDRILHIQDQPELP